MGYRHDQLALTAAKSWHSFNFLNGERMPHIKPTHALKCQSPTTTPEASTLST